MNFGQRFSRKKLENAHIFTELSPRHRCTRPTPVKMPRGCRWKRRCHPRHGQAQGPAETQKPEDPFQLPGYHYDPTTKRYFKISSDYKAVAPSPSERTAEPPAAAFPSLSLQQQLGLLRRPFQTMAVESLLWGISETSECQWKRGGLHRQLFLMQVKDSQADSVAVLYLDRLDRKTVVAIWSCSDSNQLDSSWSRHFGYPARFQDSCVASADGTDVLTCFVGNKSMAVMMHCSRPGQEEWMTLSEKDAVFSCAYNCTTGRAFFGMESGGLVYAWGRERRSLINAQSQGVGLFSGDFGSCGQVLYGGSRRGDICCMDLRCAPNGRLAYKIHLEPGALRALRVLRGDQQLLCAGDGDRLLRVDCRARKAVLGYEGHIAIDARTSFTLDEELGILCCAGQDGRTRLWNVDSGRLLKTIEPPAGLEPGEVPSAVFHSRWKAGLVKPIVIVGCQNELNTYSNITC